MPEQFESTGMSEGKGQKDILCVVHVCGCVQVRELVWDCEHVCLYERNSVTSAQEEQREPYSH